MRIDVTTYHLEMNDPRELRPKGTADRSFDIKQAQVPSPAFNRFLYTAVGGDWYWVDRLNWTYHQWIEWVDRPALQTWVVYVMGTPAGYFELEAQAQGNVELACFGLLPQFISQGLGGHLLTVAIESAWQMEATRIWVHTCSLDHPSALANYRARGFRVFREETDTQELPDKPVGPWPGAQREQKFDAQHKQRESVMHEQLKHYSDKLAYETDAWDLKVALEAGENIIVVDTRSPELFEKSHIPGAINIPHRNMKPETTGHLDQAALIVTYCDGIGCNASTKGALNMARLSFQVKELIGGFDWWQRDGHPIEGVQHYD